MINFYKNTNNINNNLESELNNLWFKEGWDMISIIWFWIMVSEVFPDDPWVFCIERDLLLDNLIDNVWLLWLKWLWK